MRGESEGCPSTLPNTWGGDGAARGEGVADVGEQSTARAPNHRNDALVTAEGFLLLVFAQLRQLAVRDVDVDKVVV